MRLAHPTKLIIAALAGLAGQLISPFTALAQDVIAAAPHDLSVTVYRNPYRNEGGFDLDNLQGFALITETRRVLLPAGVHRLRFEGVADGIEAASAIVSGLPSGVIEKNRDAALLSPSALIASAQAQGGRVRVSRTNAATGVISMAEGEIRSGPDGGVVFATAQGVEALRCSGLPETFNFEASTTGLSARPTLSVLTRNPAPVEAVVELSYLARGFDWSADYTLSMQAQGDKLDLGAWITLANGNGTGFTNARVQIVAGRLNRDTDEVEPIDIGQPILAQCWPQGTTSDTPAPITIERAFPLGFDPNRMRLERAMAMPAPPPGAGRAQEVVVVTAQKREAPEELGDLKLYRVPDRTTVASRQSKQVRLLDVEAVPVLKIYEAELYANDDVDYEPLTVILRTKNDKQSNLGIPLPSGRVLVFEPGRQGATDGPLLAGQTSLRDLAVDEETEFRLEGGADVQVRQTLETITATAPDRPPLTSVPGSDLRGASVLGRVNEVELTNARPFSINVEVRLSLDDGQRLVKADLPVSEKDGRPIFRVSVPANTARQFRYQTTSR